MRALVSFIREPVVVPRKSWSIRHLLNMAIFHQSKSWTRNRDKTGRLLNDCVPSFDAAPNILTKLLWSNVHREDWGVHAGRQSWPQNKWGRESSLFSPGPTYWMCCRGKGGRFFHLICLVHTHYILEIMPGENLSCFREILNQTELPVRHLVPVSVKSDWFLHFSLLICPKALLSNKR